MKTRYESPKLLAATWAAGVEKLLFPPHLVKELKPMDQMARWGNRLPAVRQELKEEVNRFIDGLLYLNEPEILWKAIREADPRLISLYFDRINLAYMTLESMFDKELVGVPESWGLLVEFLLLQKWPGSGSDA